MLRSAVFTAARSKDTEKVKKGVWEDNVDPSGGEIKAGCEEFVHVHPKDPQETLLHIAAFNGDADMVEWLDAHSADCEERNSSRFTAFHIALQHGCIPVLNYFFKVYDPKSDDYTSIYATPSSKPVLFIALDSAEPEVIWMILNNGLASTQDIGNAWAWVSSSEGEQSLLKKLGTQRDDILGEIRNLLMTYVLARTDHLYL
ncbi:hypothetical protein SERLA73DRAFT_189828 [Serpula lacrymans var. lacrymans S7.3]|uniref:Uncharacterized protein n=2 Tax=Serpula lacrymans var. lacrymans TaxID=341189 RepID=F8QEM4_SERL3|nr:uncharacterized protein SERLADRAFT_480946 [Serpula lacrymans var. lacrymans S7.9]EGN93280.1 hypothetical protein SERLA73DRAFT_189828 [Serpula lacrymans var. lacrymans S7.3]EGO18659.1 hypothetical protein SERLADRAFT_480946 [Serpula lacrymans var. lacrymans S7.9]